MKIFFARFIREDEGQDLIEYAFLVTFIALLAVAGLTILGDGLTDFFTDIEGQINS